MKRLCPWLLTLIVLASATPVSAQSPSLYKRIGGYDAIAAVSDDFIGRIAGDPSLGRFFAGHGKSSQARLRQLVIEQVCFATGGPCLYTGRDMKTAHAGLGITEKDWQTAVNHFLATLEKFAVPQKERDELVAIVSSLKKDVVERM
jgi:hemoglobin